MYEDIYSGTTSPTRCTAATVPAASSVNPGTRIVVTDVGPYSEWVSNGSEWYPKNGAVTLSCTGAASTLTGTTSETTMATVTVYGWMMGANGALEVTPLFDYTNSANAKTMRIKLGGTQVHSIAATTTTSCQYQSITRNTNSASSQVTQASSGSTGMGAVASSLASSSINTAADTTLTVTGQLASSGETITLRGLIVRLLK